MKLITNVKMNVIRKVCVCTLLLFGTTHGYTTDFYKKHAEGWFWYQDPSVIEEEKEEKENKDETKEKQPSQTPLNLAQKAHKQMETFKKQLEDLKVIALVNPTPQNVASYMRIQKEMVDRSENFSKTWQQVVLTNADLNPEVQNPTAQYAQHIQHDVKTQQKKQTISRLSKTYGLIYFFKGNCPYCTGFAPIVKMFADKYNWQVMAVSLDGNPSDIFPDARPDNGIGEALQVKNVPALIAYNSDTNDIIPISYAMTSLDQLENNVMALVGGES